MSWVDDGGSDQSGRKKNIFSFAKKILMFVLVWSVAVGETQSKYNWRFGNILAKRCCDVAHMELA